MLHAAQLHRRNQSIGPLIGAVLFPFWIKGSFKHFLPPRKIFCGFLPELSSSRDRIEVQLRTIQWECQTWQNASDETLKTESFVKPLPCPMVAPLIVGNYFRV